MQFAKYVKLRHEKFGAVVFDTLNEKVYITNDTGKAVLSLMEEGLSTDQIIHRLEQDYEDTAGIADDVSVFVNGLQNARLVVAMEENA